MEGAFDSFGKLTCKWYYADAVIMYYDTFDVLDLLVYVQCSSLNELAQCYARLTIKCLVRFGISQQCPLHNAVPMPFQITISTILLMLRFMAQHQLGCALFKPRRIQCSISSTGGRAVLVTLTCSTGLGSASYSPSLVSSTEMLGSAGESPACSG